MDPLTILGVVKSSLAAGRTVASLSKEIGQFFDATDAAKKKLQKKGITSSDTNSVALDRWAKEREAAQAEEQLREWVTNNLGLSQWQSLLRIRKEVLQEKREAEAQARREAQERADFALTLIAIALLLLTTFIGCVGYLHYMDWIDLRDWIK
mgnify:FL=1